MKAFLAACAAMVVIGVVAWAALDQFGMSSAAVNTVHTGSVRLN